ncbi:chromosomal replication initiator DnaA [Pseudogemmobacter faecipullorum]|uniref:Chromosomal replication initiator DnaA n=1 Tax=Pseudogemmobacter faecipullorum TaxID=2755041 RepID=A0ABS8CGB7_9RHOB|nr:chromosomal replication initiator DnaA [Pseudogemmobacter faecipullorum]
MSQQLTFDLPPRENFTRRHYMVTPATALPLAVMDDWRNWPDGKMVLTGPEGSGKSHLAAIWAAEAGAIRLPARELPLADLPELAAAGRVAVENAQELVGYRAGEEALFHLHNFLIPGGRLLVTASVPPRDWGLVQPDLLSRLQSAGLTRIDLPDDPLLQGVLHKLFADRQLQPAPQLIPWLLARMPRSFGAARRLVARMDELALARGTGPGLRLAAEVLEEMISP